MKTTLPTKAADYFQKFSTKPVEIKPFNPRAKDIGTRIIKVLNNLFPDLDLRIALRGSTAFGISGKGDIEVGVYPSEQDWEHVVNKLTQEFGTPGNIETDYARFNIDEDSFEVEIILQKGEAARVDIALTNYLMAHPELLQEYEAIKKQYAYSKRDYQIQKDAFFQRVVNLIPEENTKHSQ